MLTQREKERERQIERGTMGWGEKKEKEGLG
jgi:hypothetical protein